jgi:trimeric autotransporter adhesin
MKRNLLSFLLMSAIGSIAAVNSYSQANTALSNLVPTSVNKSLLPSSNNVLSLGNSARSWRFLCIDSAIYLRDVLTIHARGTGNFFAGPSAGNLTFNGKNNTGVGGSVLSNFIGGDANTAIGFSALNLNVAGSHNTAVGAYSMNNNYSGRFNVGIGYNAMYSNHNGLRNVAIGYNALYSNTDESGAIAIGDSALYNYTYGAFNIAIGSRAMVSNTTGGFHTAVGYQALYSNTGGLSNTAFGYQAMLKNTTGDANTAVGVLALPDNTTGYQNTAMGVVALQGVTTGNFNSALGYGATVSNGTFFNATAIGYNALATASNQVMLGNTTVNSVKAAGSYVIYSDGRFKKEVKENVPGLEFIQQLRPVTYQYDIHGMNDKMGITVLQNKQAKNVAAAIKEKLGKENEEAIIAKEKQIYTGFVAQEVEAAAKKLNYEFSGVYKPQNNEDLYGLSYSDFVVPLVKAVQELSDKNNRKDEEIALLKERLNKLESLMKISSGTVNFNSGSLDQNTPNPFSTTTTIAYTLPAKYSVATITVSDAAGKLVKTVNVSGTGRNTLNLNADNLAAGTYQYTLYVDKATADSKQFVISR